MKVVAPHVFHLPLMPRDSINSYIIEGVLIDSGIKSSYGKIAAALQQVQVHAHALTHAHPDHQGSSARVCNNYKLPLYAHHLEVNRAESGLTTAEYPRPHHLLARFQQAFWSGNGVKVNHTLKEADKMGDFVVVETPGHSSGHVSFFREKDGVLIAGDVATNMHLLTTIKGLYEPPALFTSDRYKNQQSLKKLADLHPSVVCFGHGPVLVNSHKQFEKFVDNLPY